MKPNKSEQQIRKEVLEEVKIYFEGLHIYINKVLAEINKLEEKTKWHPPNPKGHGILTKHGNKQNISRRLLRTYERDRK